MPINTVDQMRLYVREYGDPTGQTYLCLHGWPNRGTVWQGFAEALGDAFVLAPDFRGYGDSNKPEDGYTCATFAEDFCSLIAEREVRDFVLVGHSMGGKIAQLVAARQPEGLKAVVLVCPVPLIATPVPEEKKAAQRQVFTDFREHQESAPLESLLFGMAAQPLPPTYQNELRSGAEEASLTAILAWIDVMREEDFSAELPKIATPALVLHGEKDPLRSESLLREQVADHITGAKLDILPHVGHLPHLEDRETLAKRVQEFVAAVV
ncbi:MAG: alpha/beta hydrolase [Armatimonadaceae bacterium]